MMHQLALQVQQFLTSHIKLPTHAETESLPILYDDGVATAAGFEDIVAYLRNNPTVANDIDARLTTRQQTDRTAFV